MSVMLRSVSRSRNIQCSTRRGCRYRCGVSPEVAPIFTADAGDSAVSSVPTSGWLIESGEKFVRRAPAVDTGHALVGPIAVRGARAGQTLAVHIDEVRTGSWGVTKTQPPHFIRW